MFFNVFKKKKSHKRLIWDTALKIIIWVVLWRTVAFSLEVNHSCKELWSVICFEEEYEEARCLYLVGIMFSLWVFQGKFYFSVKVMLGVQSKPLNHWKQSSSKTAEGKKRKEKKKEKKKEQTWMVLAKKNKIKPLRVPLSVALAGCIYIAKVSGLGNCHSSYLCWLSKMPIPFYDPLCWSHKVKAYIYFIAVFVTWREWVNDWINNKKA